MPRWLIKRHGCNSANQSMVPTAVLGILDAETREAAWTAANERWTVYNNQSIECVAEADAKDDEWNSAVETEALGPEQHPW